MLYVKLDCVSIGALVRHIGIFLYIHRFIFLLFFFPRFSFGEWKSRSNKYYDGPNNRNETQRQPSKMRDTKQMSWMKYRLAVAQNKSMKIAQSHFILIHRPSNFNKLTNFSSFYLPTYLPRSLTLLHSRSRVFFFLALLHKRDGGALMAVYMGIFYVTHPS